jgi:autotransporter translocation and assembly factor TamB
MTAAPGRPSRVASAIVAAAVVLVVVVLVGALVLWAHYGTAVFFEIIKSGIAACI